ncbi:hypothetical protein LIPSTDRAFT_265831 [Lipomyces starkeyi NRRL Y-11557]|uniref:Uncharacterized protein n=1 Tax=Lipomyces starkeyi NRRL Y-11557 TaxID=675824 RepID=A0A1E3Q7Q7_LIPST|nr:hypothetical protein LIPSTDRAFT_265831 [Lipomyces starkeyi NRRL Y-11557]
MAESAYDQRISIARLENLFLTYMICIRPLERIFLVVVYKASNGILQVLPALSKPTRVPSGLVLMFPIENIAILRWQCLSTVTVGNRSTSNSSYDASGSSVIINCRANSGCSQWELVRHIPKVAGTIFVSLAIHLYINWVNRRMKSYSISWFSE